jgi:hypothetical protein
MACWLDVVLTLFPEAAFFERWHSRFFGRYPVIERQAHGRWRGT